MSKKSELPPGWLEVEFGDLFSLPGDDIVDGPFGSNLKASEYVNEGISIARLQNIDRNQFVAKNTKYVTREKAEELARHTFVPGDILITKLGDPLGKACLAPASIEKGVLVADVVRARITHPWVDRRFLCYQINADNIVEQFKDQTKGTTRPRVNLTKIRALKTRLCPLPEQLHIVEKLEELLTDLDAGVAELMAAQEKLAQHRQSLLKAAVEGVLTAQWRIERARRVGTDETGAQLLARILTERRARWEVEQLAKFERQDKAPPQGWQDKYPELVQPDTTDLPALPDGWAWASLDMLTEIQGGIQKQPSRMPVSNKYPFLRVANVARGQLKLDEIHEIELFEGELERFVLEKGDLLIVEGNGSLSEIGRCALWDGSIENAVHQNHLIRARPVIMQCEYLETWLNSMRGIEKLTKLAATTSGLYTLSVGKISQIPVPVPPLEEQANTVKILAVALKEQGRQKEVIEKGISQSVAQRKNILKSAFSGKLVPQDFSDEPASVLLGRISVERAARESQPKLRKMKIKKEISAMVIKLKDVLTEAADWLPAQEIFRRCGVVKGTETDRIEQIYAELREIDKSSLLLKRRVGQFDELKLKRET